MIDVKEQYVVDDQGNKTGVILDIEVYKRIMDELEELECLRAYDAAKASGDKSLPFEQAVDKHYHTNNIKDYPRQSQTAPSAIKRRPLCFHAIR